MASLRQVGRQPAGDPNVATFLTWFLPGAGHVYLGRAGAGLIAFAVVQGVYYLGLVLSGGMGFEYLQPELRGALAPVLAPEAGNLGALLWQMSQYGYGPDHPRPWPEWMALGTTLTAISGVLNVFLMVHAHTLARLPKGVPLGPRRSPAFYVGATWLLPGLGHLLQGRRTRGLLVFGALVGLFVVGTLLAEGSNLARERHYYYWGGQILVGLPTLIAEAFVGRAPIRGEIPFAEAGLVFGCLAGLLNVLAMIDVYGAAEREVFGVPEPDEASAVGAPEQPAAAAREGSL